MYLVLTRGLNFEIGTGFQVVIAQARHPPFARKRETWQFWITSRSTRSIVCMLLATEDLQLLYSDTQVNTKTMSKLLLLALFVFLFSGSWALPPSTARAEPLAKQRFLPRSASPLCQPSSGEINSPDTNDTLSKLRAFATLKNRSTAYRCAAIDVAGWLTLLAGLLLLGLLEPYSTGAELFFAVTASMLLVRNCF